MSDGEAVWIKNDRSTRGGDVREPHREQKGEGELGAPCKDRGRAQEDQEDLRESEHSQLACNGRSSLQQAASSQADENERKP